ncbi:ribonuclease H-like domain-containing protein [Tanacetum coccineum]
MASGHDFHEIEEVLQEDREKWQVAMTKVECFNFHNMRHFARECRSKGNQESRRRDAGNIGYKAQDNRRRPGKHEEPKALVTLDGDGVDWTGHAEDEQENFALMAYNNSGFDTEVEAQLVCHQKNQLVYEEKIRFMKIDLDDKTNVLIYHKKLLAEAIKEKEELKTKLENFQSSSKGLSKLLNCQMSAKDKSGLGYGDQSLNVETLEFVPKLAVNEPKVVSKPKVWSDAPIIEEYESDCDDEYVIKPSKEQEKPSFAFVNTVKHVKTPRETVKEQNTCSLSPKANKKDWNGLMSKKLGLGFGFTRKACFVCGSFGHLIRDCDFYEKRMAKQVELNKQKGKGTGQGENRPVWNNVQRLNHQNKFVLKVVLTKTGRFPVNAARQTLSSKAVATSTARKVNTARPILTTAPKANFTNHKVNTVGDKTVSAIGGNRETAVKASTAVSQTVNNVSQIKATISGQTVLISKSSIRIDLLFNDDNGIDCLTVADIYENLPLMGSKSTSWDQFPTNVISAVICLATDRTFNFSKMIFDGMNRNLEAKKKFLMYPRFVQVFLNTFFKIYCPLDNLPILVLSKKVFTNMTRRGLHFSGHVTPLFPTMLVPIAVQEGEGSGTHIEPQPTPSPTQPSVSDQTHVTESSSRPENTQNSRNTLEGTGGSEGDQVQLPYDSPLSGGHTSDSAEGGLNLEELFVLCTNLSSRVLALETSKDAQAIEIL